MIHLPAGIGVCLGSSSCYMKVIDIVFDGIHFRRVIQIFVEVDQADDQSLF